MKQSDSSQKSRESKLDIYFDELKSKNYDDTFPAAEAWLRTINTNLSNHKNKTERKFSYMNIKKYFTANKFKLAYTFLILAFVVAACNYPVTQQESAGDVLKWTVSKDNTEAIKQIENFDWFKNGEYNVNDDNNYLSYSLVIPKENHENAAAYEKQLETIGVTTVNLIPLNETVKRPVYSALLNDLFKIDINASNMSDTELSKEIDAQLKNAGIENATVDFEKNKDGHRMVKLNIPEQEIKKDGGFDMTIKDGDNVTKMKEVRKTGTGDPDRFNGKTDEEIKKMVKEDMQLPDLKNDQIEIIRKDGKVMIKIKKSDLKSKIEIEDEIK